MTDYQSPDWVVLGAPWGEQFAIIASNDLTYGELTMERDELDIDLYRAAPMFSQPRYEVKVGMKKYVIIVGDNYTDCFQRLVQTWSPEPTAERAIGRGPERRGSIEGPLGSTSAG